LHRARLAANLGDVDGARAVLEGVHHASLAVNGEPAPARIVWFVNVVALIAAGRFDEAEPWLDRAPQAAGVIRRQLEYDEQRVRCLLVLRPEDGVNASADFLAALGDAPAGTVGAAWRLRAAADLGTRLVRVAGASPVTRAAWDLAGHAILTRVAQIEQC